MKKPKVTKLIDGVRKYSMPRSMDMIDHFWVNENGFCIEKFVNLQSLVNLIMNNAIPELEIEAPSIEKGNLAPVENGFSDFESCWRSIGFRKTSLEDRKQTTYYDRKRTTKFTRNQVKQKEENQILQFKLNQKNKEKNKQ